MPANRYYLVERDLDLFGSMDNKKFSKLYKGPKKFLKIS